MMSFAAFFAWLLQLPAWSRLAAINRALLQRLIRALADPASPDLLKVDPETAWMIERALQAAEAGISRAEWLLAFTLNGAVAPPLAAPLRPLPPHRAPDHAALIRRALSLLARLDAIESRARRLQSLLGAQTQQQAPHPIRSTATRTLRAVEIQMANSSRTERTARAQNTNLTASNANFPAASQTGPPLFHRQSDTPDPTPQHPPILRAPALVCTPPPA